MGSPTKRINRAPQRLLSPHDPTDEMNSTVIRQKIINKIFRIIYWQIKRTRFTISQLLKIQKNAFSACLSDRRMIVIVYSSCSHKLD